jgi:hypothetical protein
MGPALHDYTPAREVACLPLLCYARALSQAHHGSDLACLPLVRVVLRLGSNHHASSRTLAQIKVPRPVGETDVAITITVPIHRPARPLLELSARQARCRSPRRRARSRRDPKSAIWHHSFDWAALRGSPANVRGEVLLRRPRPITALLVRPLARSEAGEQSERASSGL